MTLTVRRVPMLSDNYAWLLKDEASGATGFVDPADEAAASAAVREAGGRLDFVLLTHHHDDHTAGAAGLARGFGARIVGNRADRRRLPKLDVELAEGDDFALGGAHARIIDTPGHTVGHVAYAFEADRALFCGDTLFSLGCGRLFEGTPAQMFASLRKLAALDPETLVYCGHEYTASNARFALSADPENPALRERAAEVERLRAEGRPTIPVKLS
ncbi:MAG TPA: hydroxyacylglutathione hydrolase, partial [Acetobacteraceae bacterium]|nr:hydroxyacylglutathione hydrolase [Acetobacteraceae bacterium]